MSDIGSKIRRTIPLLLRSLNLSANRQAFTLRIGTNWRKYPAHLILFVTRCCQCLFLASYKLREYSGSTESSLELFIHEVLPLDCKVKVHPEILGSKSRPVFRVRHGNYPYYVDTTVINPSTHPFAHNQWDEDAVIKFNKLSHPLFYI